MPSLPSSLSLTSIADGSPIIAADHRNNYASVQTDVNALIAFLTPTGSGQVLQSTSTSAATWVSGVKTTATTLAAGPPGAPADGDIWIATAVDANGAVWQFRYNAGSASANKWEFIGGTPMFAEVTTSESRANVAYGDLATQGPVLTLARAGDYMVTTGAQIYNDSGTHQAWMSYDIGGGGAADADAFSHQSAGGTSAAEQLPGGRTRKKTGITAGQALTAKYRTDGTGNGIFSNRFMAIVPVRVI